MWKKIHPQEGSWHKQREGRQTRKPITSATGENQRGSYFSSCNSSAPATKRLPPVGAFPSHLPNAPSQPSWVCIFLPLIQMRYRRCETSTRRSSLWRNKDSSTGGHESQHREEPLDRMLTLVLLPGPGLPTCELLSFSKAGPCPASSPPPMVTGCSSTHTWVPPAIIHPQFHTP